MNKRSAYIEIWDIPTRLFHWLLVAGVLVCWISVENQWMEVHQISGMAILVLLIYRLIWGFVGSTTARFSGFLTSPAVALRYLRGSLGGDSEFHTGHNPAGGWMVLLLFSVLTFQVTTGLFANNDLGFSGALADNVSKATSDQMTGFHQISFNIILACIWLHLLAVFFYVLAKGQNLVRAMITGKKPAAQAGETRRMFFTGPGRALATLAISAGIAAWILM